MRPTALVITPSHSLPRTRPASTNCPLKANLPLLALLVINVSRAMWPPVSSVLSSANEIALYSIPPSVPNSSLNRTAPLGSTRCQKCCMSLAEGTRALSGCTGIPPPNPHNYRSRAKALLRHCTEGPLSVERFPTVPARTVGGKGRNLPKNWAWHAISPDTSSSRRYVRIRLRASSEMVDRNLRKFYSSVVLRNAGMRKTALT